MKEKDLSSNESLGTNIEDAKSYQVDQKHNKDGA